MLRAGGGREDQAEVLDFCAMNADDTLGRASEPVA